MPFSDNYFYQGTEGYLGDPGECKLLFLMREPNCGENLTVRQGEFWFKSVVDGSKQDKTYLSKLGQIASLLTFGKPATNDEERRSALKKAIYINMNPVSGKGRKSPEYAKALENFMHGSFSATDDPCRIKVELNDEEEKTYEYPSRWNVLLGMTDGSYIVTVSDIYTVLLDRLIKEEMIVSPIANKKLRIATRKVWKTMRSFDFEYKGKTITVLDTLHPKSRAGQFYQWNDITLE